MILPITARRNTLRKHGAVARSGSASAFGYGIVGVCGFYHTHALAENVPSH